MECSYCKKKFSSKSSLNSHQKTTKYCLKLRDDSKLNHFKKCEYCDKSFTTKQNLLIHYIECKNKAIQDAVEKERDKLQKDFDKINSTNKIIVRNFDNSLVLNNITIISRSEDGYINVTQLCKAGGKEFKHWKENKNTEAFLHALSSSVGIPTDTLISYESGSNDKRSSWAHPQVAINIAQWISPQFDVQVSKWIFELMLTGKVELSNEKTNSDLESIYQDKINTLNKELEFKTNKLKDYDTTTFNQTSNICPIEYYTKDVVYFFKFDVPINLQKQYIDKYPNINNKDYKCIEFGVTSDIEERIKTHKRDKKKDGLILIHLIELDKRYTASKMEHYIKIVSKQMNINFEYEKNKECIIANEHEFNVIVNKIKKGIENTDEEVNKYMSLDIEIRKLETNIELHKIDIELEIKKLEKEEIFRKIESANDLFKNNIIDFEQYKVLITF